LDQFYYLFLRNVQVMGEHPTSGARHCHLCCYFKECDKKLFKK
jgi:hypothetical protein